MGPWGLFVHQAFSIGIDSQELHLKNNLLLIIFLLEKSQKTSKSYDQET